MRIAAKGITKEFIRSSKGTNRLVAVAPADLEIAEGKLTLLMGRSGSGKSTLLNMLAGLLTPTSGTLTYDGSDIYAMNDDALSLFRCEHIGVIPQGQTAVHSLNVLENICLSYMLYPGNESREAVRSRAEMLMKKLGIAELENAMPSELSGGELRRMAIARAMIREPDIIFADEPTCDLDDENTLIVLDILKEAAQSGTSVFMVTHEKDAENFADIRLEMSSGTLSESKH